MKKLIEELKKVQIFTKEFDEKNGYIELFTEPDREICQLTFVKQFNHLSVYLYNLSKFDDKRSSVLTYGKEIIRKYVLEQLEENTYDFFFLSSSLKDALFPDALPVSENEALMNLGIRIRPNHTFFYIETKPNAINKTIEMIHLLDEMQQRLKDELPLSDITYRFRFSETELRIYYQGVSIRFQIQFEKGKLVYFNRRDEENKIEASSVADLKNQIKELVLFLAKKERIRQLTNPSNHFYNKIINDETRIPRVAYDKISSIFLNEFSPAELEEKCFDIFKSKEKVFYHYIEHSNHCNNIRKDFLFQFFLGKVFIIQYDFKNVISLKTFDEKDKKEAFSYFQTIIENNTEFLLK